MSITPRTPRTPRTPPRTGTTERRCPDAPPRRPQRDNTGTQDEVQHTGLRAGRPRVAICLFPDQRVRRYEEMVAQRETA